MSDLSWDELPLDGANGTSRDPPCPNLAVQQKSLYLQAFPGRNGTTLFLLYIAQNNEYFSNKRAGAGGRIRVYARKGILCLSSIRLSQRKEK
jgi:hypothetical protein